MKRRRAGRVRGVGRLGSPARAHRQGAARHYTEAANVAGEIIYASQRGDCSRAVDLFERFGAAYGAAHAERMAAGEKGHADEMAAIWGVHDKAVAAFRKNCPFKHER